MLGFALSDRSVHAAVRQPTCLETFRALFDQFRLLGQTASPTIVLPVLIAQTQTMQGIATRSDSHAKGPALLLAARIDCSGPRHNEDDLIPENSPSESVHPSRNAVRQERPRGPIHNGSLVRTLPRPVALQPLAARQARRPVVYEGRTCCTDQACSTSPMPDRNAITT
jgi:hypothetical protein